MDNPTDEMAFWERVFLAQMRHDTTADSLGYAAAVAEAAVRARREFKQRNQAERDAWLEAKAAKR